ncbi:MAG: hypothetical protein M1821_000608 [Bathelium mastoideum]|nr:MAG: hypothetical protein M1821_000608 [Bathelium mastoideum]
MPSESPEASGVIGPQASNEATLGNGSPSELAPACNRDTTEQRRGLLEELLAYTSDEARGVTSSPRQIASVNTIVDDHSSSSKPSDIADGDSDNAHEYHFTEEEQQDFFQATEGFLHGFSNNNDMTVGSSNRYDGLTESVVAAIMEGSTPGSGVTGYPQDYAETDNDSSLPTIPGWSENEDHLKAEHFSDHLIDDYSPHYSGHGRQYYAGTEPEHMQSVPLYYYGATTTPHAYAASLNTNIQDADPTAFVPATWVGHHSPDGVNDAEVNGSNYQNTVHGRGNTLVAHGRPTDYSDHDLGSSALRRDASYKHHHNRNSQLNYPAEQSVLPTTLRYDGPDATGHSHPLSSDLLTVGPHLVPPIAASPSARDLLPGTRLDKMQPYVGFHRDAGAAFRYMCQTRRNYDVDGHDDWQSVELNPGSFVRDIYEAMSTIVPNPDSAQLSYWNTMTRKGHEQAMLEGRAWDIVHTAITQHKYGISNFPELEINKRDPTDMAMRCSERLYRIKEILYFDKLVCKDVVDGNKISYLVATPNAWITRKNDNRRLNKDKGAIMRAGKKTVHKFQNARFAKDKKSGTDQDADYTESVMEGRATTSSLEMLGGAEDRPVESNVKPRSRPTRSSKRVRRQEPEAEQVSKQSKGKRKASEMD